MTLIRQLFFILTILIATTFYSSGQDFKYHMNCKIDSLQGYIVVLVNKPTGSKYYNTHYGFISGDSVMSNARFLQLLNNSDTLNKLKNLPNEDYQYLVKLIQFPLVYDNSRISQLVWINNCDKTFKTELSKGVIDANNRIPNLNSFWFSKTISNVRKPEYILIKRKLKFVYLKYDSYDNYIKEQIDDVLKTIQPRRKSLLFGFKYPIKLSKIEKAVNKDGYDIIIPLDTL